MDIDEIAKLEQQVEEKWGFVSQEIKFIMRFKPTFLFQQGEKSPTGMHTLHDYFVVQHGMTDQFLKTLVVKYPHILSKSQKDLNKIIGTLGEQGIST